MMKRLCLLLLIAAMANIAGAAPDDTTSQSQVNPNEISQESANQAVSEAMQLTRFQKAVAFIKRNKACLVGDECPLALSASLNFALGFVIGSLTGITAIKMYRGTGTKLTKIGLSGDDFISNFIRSRVQALMASIGLGIGAVPWTILQLGLHGEISNLCYVSSPECEVKDVQTTYLFSGFVSGLTITGAYKYFKNNK